MIFEVEKPLGILSTDVVNYIKEKYKVRKAGHGGALDPLATGSLLIATDRDTKQLQHYLTKDKVYNFKVVFGMNTLTGDLEADADQIWFDDKHLSNAPSEAWLTKLKKIIAQDKNDPAVLKNRGEKNEREGMQIFKKT